MRDVTLQDLHHSGLNPFAVELLTESWRSHHKGSKPVAFIFRGVKVSLGYDPHSLEAACKAADHLISSLLAVRDERDGATDALLREVQAGIRAALGEKAETPTGV